VNKFIGHLHTINSHRRLVLKLCFKCGLYKQGLLHDLSKYSPIEFFSGVKYYQGYRSPITAEKIEKGYSKGWLHHKGHNKHHWEHWIDTMTDFENYNIDMPDEYIIESVLDKIAASKIYKKQEYTNSSPYDFFMNSKERHKMSKYNASKIEKCLLYLKENGEEKALIHYKELYKQVKNNGNAIY